jgi:hypothetical protein
MSRQFKDGRCSCWKKVNENLDEFGTCLSLAFSMTGHIYLEIGTERSDGQPGSARSLVASYCPFCGAKLKGEVGK